MNRDLLDGTEMVEKRFFADYREVLPAWLCQRLTAEAAEAAEKQLVAVELIRVRLD
jgi:hypothetical protein